MHSPERSEWLSRHVFSPYALCVLVLSFNLLGDGLRDALDPRHK